MGSMIASNSGALALVTQQRLASRLSQPARVIELSTIAPAAPERGQQMQQEIQHRLARFPRLHLSTKKFGINPQIQFKLIAKIRGAVT